MATKRKSRTRNEVIRCPSCGEDYSVTYRYCPFCEEAATRSRSRNRGGKRLNTRGGGYGKGGWGPVRVLSTLFSLGLIFAAVYIVITVVKPLVELGANPGVTSSPTPTHSVAPTAQPTAEPTAEPSAEPSTEPSPSPSPSAPAATAERFTLNASDFTLSRPGETYRIIPSFSPAGSSGVLTWTSSNPTAVHVDGEGTVTALAAGNSTITAKLPNGHSQKCIVRCGWSDNRVYPTPGTGSTPAQPTEENLTLNREDITMRQIGETFALKVTGTTSTVTWSSSNPEVASVSSLGVVTAKGSGTATIKATVNGITLKCIIRCKF